MMGVMGVFFRRMKVYFGKQMVVGRNRSVTVERHDGLYEE